MANELWRNQIEQINVLPNRGIELVPRVGDHIIYLGNLPETSAVEKRELKIQEFVNKKMTRLENFYKYGLSQAGWNKYSYINLEFDNQIICKSITTAKNIKYKIIITTMPKEFIVAIELGSSKMTGIAGQKNLDGSITVLALVEEDSSSCIRKV